MVKLWALATAWILIVIIPMQAQAAEISVRSDRNPVALNESFQLIYETEDDVDDDPDFSILEPLLDILNRSQSSNISIVNGRYSSKKTWTLTVMARRSGELELPLVAFGADLSQGLSLTVNPASQNQGQLNEFFLRLQVDRKQVKVQQQVIVTLQLYSAYNLSGYAIGDLVFGGMEALVESLGKERTYSTRIGERGFRVVERQYALFPQQAGSLQIEPVLAEGQTGSRSNNLFDPFGSRGRIVRTRSEPLVVDVQPVPAGVSMNPWLPAESLEISEQWSMNPPRFRQGEPVTRTLSVKAQGLTAAQLPELQTGNLAQIKQYPDQPLLQDTRNSSGISGYRVEKIAYVPTEAGRFELPAIEIAWWDTGAQQARVATLPARMIEVEAVVQLAPQPAPPAVAATPDNDQPAPLQSAGDNVPTLSDSQTSTAQMVSWWWMWLAVIVSLAWMATMMAWWASHRRLPAADVEQRSLPPADSSRSLRAALDACHKQDPVALRQALIAWGRIQFQDPNLYALAQLKQQLPAELHQALGQLDQSLYADRPGEVDFVTLEQQLRMLKKARKPPDNTRESSTLEPLYR